jgi:flavin reductase (DIM6/NTAB) family NADH-FMN oxidoreductase RutF
MVKASGTFALSFLEAGQKDLAQNFFKPLHRVGDEFADIEFYPAPETGCPVIKDSLGYIECRLVGTVEHGDHTVFVGEVVGAAASGGATPAPGEYRLELSVDSEQGPAHSRDLVDYPAGSHQPCPGRGWLLPGLAAMAVATSPGHPQVSA